jgi:hypothetical protein
VDADDFDQGKMHWFGAPWDSWLCEECPHVPMPVGQTCLWCHEPIEEGDSGVTQLCFLLDQPPQRRPQHLECHIRSVCGGLNHLLGQCMCCGGDAPPDPPTLSRREAARAAALFVQRRAQIEKPQY